MLQDTEIDVIIYYIAGMTLTLALVTAIVIYIFLYQRRVNRFHLQLEQEQRKKQEAIYAALQEGEEKERNRIAEELHDGVSAKLSGLNMTIDYLRTRIVNDEYRILIDKTFEGLNETIDELREISHNLQMVSVTEKSIKQPLDRFIEQLNSKNECHYTLFLETSLDEVSDKVRHHCYRIITELLNNIRKHARATEASVQITAENNSLEIIAEDNGVGFRQDNGPEEGIGLQNIRNRVTLNKGSITIDSSEKGTTIIIELPF